MNPHYNQNYSREEIKDILAKIKECVATGKYTISLNERCQENIDFINEYNIRSDRQKSILMQIEVEDFVIHYKIPKVDMNMKYSMFLFLKYNFNAGGEKETVDFIYGLMFLIYHLKKNSCYFIS